MVRRAPRAVAAEAAGPPQAVVELALRQAPAAGAVVVVEASPVGGEA